MTVDDDREQPGIKAQAPAEGAPSTEKLAAWLATGFALLTGLVTFFGLKDGKLDEALSQFQFVALLVLFLVGGAVVATAAAAAIPTDIRIRFPLVVLAITGLLVLCWRKYPDIGDVADDRTVWLVGGVAVVIAVLATWPVEIGAAAAVIIVATASLGLGLYGAAKIGVLAADFRIGVEVNATVTRTPADGATADVAVAVSADGLDDNQVLRVTLLDAESSTTEVELGYGYAVPSLGGALDGTMSFRVPATVSTGVVRVARCYLDEVGPTTEGDGTPNQDHFTCPEDPGEVFTRFGIESGTPPKPAIAPFVAASITAETPAGPAKVSVTGASLEAAATVEIVVSRAGEEVAASTVRTAADGTFTWSATVQAEPDEPIDVIATMTTPQGEPVAASATYRPPPAPSTTTSTIAMSTDTTPQPGSTTGRSQPLVPEESIGLPEPL